MRLYLILLTTVFLGNARRTMSVEACDPRVEICFQGIGDLPGGNIYSDARGVARLNGESVVVGECHSERSAASGGTEPCKYSNGIHRVLDAQAPNAFGVALDVALVGTQTIIIGFVGAGAMRAVQSGDELVIPDILLAPNGAPAFSAISMSDDGRTVVGYWDAPGGLIGSFRWTQQSGVSTALPDLDRRASHLIINGVSPNGVFAVGSDHRPEPSFSPNGYVYPGPSDLICIGGPCPPRGTGDLPGGIDSSMMFAVTNSARAVGYGNTAAGQEAFMWIPGRVLISPDQRIALGDLPGGSTLATANSISGDGTVVVGMGTSALGSEAFIWRADLGMRNLREFFVQDHDVSGLDGWRLLGANAISTDGLAIAGSGRNPDGNNEGWFITLPDCNNNNRWDGLEAVAPFTETTRSVLSFDGVDDFLESAAPSDALRITGDLTIEAWIYLHRLGVTQSVITLGEAGESQPTNILYAVEVDANGDIRVAHERSDFADVSVTADTNLHVGQWYHLAVVRETFSATLLEYKVYVDGLEPIVEGAIGRPAGGSAGRLRIGRAEGTIPDRPFDGFIADLRIWNVKRTPEQIRESMFSSTAVDTTGLVGSWLIDEASGGLVSDSVGTNHLTLLGSSRETVDSDCNRNRVPDTCETDCNDNGIPDTCDLRDASSRDCDLNGRPDECDTTEALAELLNQDRAAAEVFREGRNDPTSGTTFGTMIQKYGRPWKPGTGQTPGGGVCSGGERHDLACAGTTDCPGGSCVPPVGPGIELKRNPAERLRMLIADPSCIPTDLAQRILQELFSFEMLLGNEAFADALDPTVGVGSDNDLIALEQVPGLFAFRGLPGINSLLEEELALLRGREIALPLLPNSPLNDELAANPNGNYPQFETATATRAAIYNRLRPNATDSLGSVGYRTNYGDPPNNETASGNYPQGHGDAFGYYLSATKFYLDVFGAEKETTVPSEVSRALVESQLVPEGSADCGAGDCETIVDDDGITHHVGFQSVRNMVAAMAAKARSAIRIVDLTFRRDYREDTDTRLKDTDAARAWATADWARRGGIGAYFDWAVANHLLPVPEEGAADTIESVHRQRVDEVRLLTSAVEEMQERVDAAGAGLNPLALVSNVVPFRIIQPGQLLDFLQGGSSAGQSHYGIVRNAAMEAIKNARGILMRANRGANRLRGNEQMFTEFENQVRQTDVGLNDRLIEILGLPSASDTADNDLEDNDGDGVQLTGGVNDPEDDFIEAGCDGECAGSPDLVNFLIDSQTQEDLGWVDRAAVGQVQLAMFELRAAILRVQVADQSMANLEALIGDKAENVALFRSETVEQLEIQDEACDRRQSVIDRKEKLARSRARKGFMSRSLGLIGAAAACGATGGPSCAPVVTGLLDLANDQLGIVGDSQSDEIGEEFNIQREELDINCWQTAELTEISEDRATRALEIELEDLIRKTPLSILEVATAETQARQAFAVVRKSFQEGKRLLDERDRNRRVQSDKLQQFRFRDMAFRTFRNQALEQYGAFFDLAGRYVMLAARAFAYEYNERDEVSDQMRRLHRERLLGTESAADQGLESIIARLDQKRQESDFVARLQKLSLFDHGGDEFSLRKNLLGLAINPSEDTDQQQFEKNKAFRAFLESHIVQELNDVPAFRQLASFDSDRDAGPALVLTFSTEVAGRTLFGQTRGTTFGAPANFDSCSNPKLFEFAILLEGVDNPSAIGVDSPLVFAHFLPVGTSMLRAPESGNCAFRAVRSWEVVDQRIPGVSAAYRDSGGAILDSFAIPRLATSPELNIINRFPVTQAQVRMTENPVFQDDLAGWSVWNTQWLLAIPGRQFASPSATADVVRRKLLMLIFDSNESGSPRSPDDNLGIDDIKLRIKAYGKPS